MGQVVFQRFPLGGDEYREDQIGPFTTDANALLFAEDVAEKHTAGWVFYLAGREVPAFELATLVRVEGLERRRPHPQGVRVWQCEGAALLIMTGLEPDPAKLHAYLEDYRVTEGRIDRKRTATSVRAALICAEIERGVHPKEAFDRHKLPSVTRDAVIQAAAANPHAQDEAALRYYRQLVSAGEVE